MEPLNVRDIILDAADLLEPEGRFCQINFAEDKKGRPVEIGSKDACKWDIAGAVILVSHKDILHLSGEDYNELAKERMAKAREALNIVSVTVGEPVHKFGDAYGRTQSEIVSALRRSAIQLSQ